MQIILESPLCSVSVRDWRKFRFRAVATAAGWLQQWKSSMLIQRLCSSSVMIWSIILKFYNSDPQKSRLEWSSCWARFSFPPEHFAATTSYFWFLGAWKGWWKRLGEVLRKQSGKALNEHSHHYCVIILFCCHLSAKASDMLWSFWSCC